MVLLERTNGSTAALSAASVETIITEGVLASRSGIGRRKGTSLNYRTLGRTGLEVSEMGYGAWGIGKDAWLGAEDDESLRALNKAIDLGLNFIDTALAYGAGHSERLVGQVIKERDETVYVATKVPPKNREWPAPARLPPDEVFPRGYG